MAQDRSASCSSLTRRMRPSAVTICAESRLSIVRPNLRLRRPKPPPSVYPPMPVCETASAVVIRPCSRAALSSPNNSAPPPARARRAFGSTFTSFIRNRSITRPPSHTDFPGQLWPPPRTATSRSRSRAKVTARLMSSAPHSAKSAPAATEFVDGGLRLHAEQTVAWTRPMICGSRRPLGWELAEILETSGENRLAWRNSRWRADGRVALH